MRLYGTLFPDDPTVTNEHGSTDRYPVAISFGDVQVKLTRAQATKLCFDLLATVPSVEMTAHLNHGVYPEMVTP